MGRLRFLLTALVAAGISFSFATSGVVAGERSSGAFKAPPVGTVCQYNNFTTTIASVDGHEISYDAGSRTNMKLYGWLMTDPRGSAKFDRSAIDSLWPLSVGKTASLKVTRKTGMWRITFSVVGRETVSVPAGNFETFVVQENQRGIGHRYEKERTRWYSPELGTLVKSESLVTKGVSYGKRSSYQLVRMTYPGGKTVP